MADSVTVLQDVGTSGGKKTLAILGDGFAAGSDQTTYNNYVRDEVMRGVFVSDAFNEDLAAWNIRRVNLESATSGASTRTWNLMGTTTTADDTFTDNIVNTALDIISNGEWWHNWFEDGATTQANIDAAIAKWAPGADFALIVVNSTLPAAPDREHPEGHHAGNGGSDRPRIRARLRRPRRRVQRLKEGQLHRGRADAEQGERHHRDGPRQDQVAPVHRPWHADPDRYGGGSGYTAGTPPAGWDDQDDAGLFEGAHTWETGIYRPAVNCRMRHNADAFCPPCYTEMKEKHHNATGRRFRTVVAGRFTSSSRSEFFGIDERGVSLYRANGTRWEHVRTTAGIIPVVGESGTVTRTSRATSTATDATNSSPLTRPGGRFRCSVSSRSTRLAVSGSSAATTPTSLAGVGSPAMIASSSETSTVTGATTCS